MTPTVFERFRSPGLKPVTAKQVVDDLVTARHYTTTFFTRGMCEGESYIATLNRDDGTVAEIKVTITKGATA